MARDLVDLVKIYATNTGTGPFVLGPAVSSFRGAEALTDTNTYGYSVRQGSNYEVGTGVFSLSGGTLTRTVEWSSNGNAPISLGPNAIVNFTALAADIRVAGPPGPTGPAGPAGPTADLSGLMEKAANLGDVADVPTARSNLGLGAAALLALTDLDERSRDAIGTALQNGGGLVITVDDAGDTITVKLASYIFSVNIIAIATASEVVGLHVAGAAFTIPANFGSGSLLSFVGVNPTASYAIDVQKNGTTIGTITISTLGVVTATTTGGTSKAIAANDVLKFVAPGTADATAALIAMTIIGVR